MANTSSARLSSLWLTTLLGGRSSNEAAAQYTIDEVSKINKDDGNMVEEIIRRYKAKWRAAWHKYRFTGPAEWPEGPDPLEALANDPKDGIRS